MADDVYKPFDKDIEAYGEYQYTGTAKRSALYSNRRYSDITLSSVDFTGKRAVDVGCGDGTYTAVICEETRVGYILGIDPALKAIERATAAYASKYVNMEFRRRLAVDLVNNGERFDIAVYRGVIHHTGDPAAEIATAMKLAGTVFFIEPNGWNPILKLIERLSPYHRAHEERSYRVGQFKKWIEEAGGKIEKYSYHGLVPFFCPDWMVTLGAALEPIVERMPIIRMFCCAVVAITAKSGYRRELPDNG